jgi:hypothetical protein
MLTVDYKQRITAREALTNEWFSNNADTNNVEDDIMAGVMKKM